jgi:hypothetical protein
MAAAPERESLVVEMHRWAGDPIAKEGLRPPAAPTEALAYGYLGDLELRLLFRRPGLGAAVRREDLQQLELTPGKAVSLGAQNVLRGAGPAQIAPLQGGVYMLRGARPEDNALYLLDRNFWRGQLQKFPQGLVAALPRRGALLFAPGGSPEVEGELLRQAAAMAASAGAEALSGLYYRFDAEGWHPLGSLPKPVAKAAAPAAPDDEDASRPSQLDDDVELDDALDLEKAAQGQRMLVMSVIGGFVLNAMARAGVQPVLMLALLIALAIYGLLGVVRLGTGLGKSTGATIFCMVLSFFPLLNLLCWIALSVQATRALRAAGWQVGLLGAKA